MRVTENLVIANVNLVLVKVRKVPGTGFSYREGEIDSPYRATIKHLNKLRIAYP